MAYRKAASSKGVAIVRYRALPRVAAFLLPAVVCSFGAVALFQAATYARRSYLDCVRSGPNACVLVREYGPFVTRRTIPLRSIVGVGVSRYGGMGGVTYAVEAWRADGRSEQLSRAGEREPAHRARDQITRFLESDADDRARIALDEPSPLNATMAGLFAIAMGALALLFVGRAARLEFDFERGAIRYLRPRFPLPAIRRTLRANEVRGARLTTFEGARGPTIHGVALDLEGGETLALIPDGGGSKEHTEDVVRRIEALLAEMQQRPPYG